MKNKIVRVSALFVLMTSCVFAQQKDSIASKTELDEVVISDSKFALAKEKSGKVIVKITTEELAKKSGQSLATVLSTVAGLEVNGNQSSASKNLSYYIRGGRNRQTLILIDGIPVTDASGVNLDYDLRLIPVEQVENIEIMKGAASTLYGSGAATGVINITLKKAGKKAIEGNVYLNMGTQTTANIKNNSLKDFNQGFSFNGKTEKFNYFFALNSTETTGISEAKPELNSTQFEADGFSRINSMAKMGFTPTKKLSFDFFANYDRLKNDFDAGNFSDDLQNYNTSVQYRLGFTPKYKYNKGEFVVNSGASFMNRNNYSGSFTNYKSRNFSADVFNKYQVLDELFIVSGTQFQFFDMEIDGLYTQISERIAKFNLLDPYITAVYNSDFGLNINSGARLNIHNKYGNKVVYNINPSFSFSEIPLKIVSSFSTAYITPSLYQLYDGFYGNLDLKPEENTTIELGFELIAFNKKVNWNFVTFYREENNNIGFISGYANIEGKFNAKGVETMVSYSVSNALKINANYTFTAVEAPLSRLIPKHKANFSLDYQASPRIFFNLNYQFVDLRKDAFYDMSINATKTVVLEDYQLFNALAKFNLMKNKISVFATINNILNEDFEENVGYNTRGRNFKLGLNISL